MTLCNVTSQEYQIYQWLGKDYWKKHFVYHDFVIVLIGDRNSLYSPFLSNLLGKDHEASLKSTECASTCSTVDRVQVTTHMVPALSDATGYKDEGYTKEMQAILQRANLVIFCIDMSDTRLRGSVLRTLQQLKTDWSRTVIVLTFADALSALMRHRENPRFPKGLYFDTKLHEWTRELKAMLEHVGVRQKVVAKMKFYPSANEPAEPLPNGEPWLAPLSLAIMDILSSKGKEEFLEEHAMLFSTSAAEQPATLSPTDAAAAALMTVGVSGTTEIDSSSESGLQVSSAPRVLSEYQSRSINAALSKLRKDCPVFGVLVIGRTGAGKSTLINNLLGKEVASVGHTLKSETSKVNPHEYSVEGVAIVVYDTPGLGDVKGEEDERKHLDIMKSLLARGKIHLVVYCFQMNETILKSSHVGTLCKYHQIGVDWEQSVIALTFADALYVPESDWKLPMSHCFDQKLVFWQRELKRELVETVGVPANVVERLKIYPTTPIPKDRLLNGNPWYVPLWLHIVDILPPAATVRFVDIHKGNICDRQTPPLRKHPKTEVNLSRRDMIQFAGTFASAVEAAGVSHIEQPPPMSKFAKVEIKLPGENGQLAVTVVAPDTVTSEDFRDFLMANLKTAGDFHNLYMPTEHRQRQNSACCYLCCVCRRTAAPTDT